MQNSRNTTLNNDSEVSTRILTQQLAQSIGFVFDSNQVRVDYTKSSYVVSPVLLTIVMRLLSVNKVDTIMKLGPRIEATGNFDNLSMLQKGANVCVQIPLPEHLRTQVDPDKLNPDDIGVDFDNKSVPFYMGDKGPHVVLFGTSGAGKTVSMLSMIHTVITSTTPEQAQVVLFDPLNKYPFLDGLPHLVLPRAVEDKELGDSLTWLYGQYQKRRKMAKENNWYQPEHFPNRLVVFIEELDAVMLTDEDWQLFDILLSKGRNFGIHIVSNVQKVPDTKAVTIKVFENASHRFIGYLTNKQIRAYLSGVAGIDGTGSLGSGDFFEVSSKGVSRLQFKYTEEKHFMSIPRVESPVIELPTENVKEQLVNAPIDIPRPGRPKKNYNESQLIYSLHYLINTGDFLSYRKLDEMFGIGQQAAKRLRAATEHEARLWIARNKEWRK